MTIEVEQMRRVKRVARFAAARNLPITTCPYDAGGDDRQRALAFLWVRTYLAHRPPPPGTIHYGG